MDDKQRVLSVLRALLVSNGKNNKIPLRELKQDYCAHEKQQEIPSFGHKSVIDFLVSSGEFILDIETTGLVSVRQKPKLKSFMNSLVTQSQSIATSTSCTVNNVFNETVCEKPKLEPPSKKSSFDTPRMYKSTTVFTLNAEEPVTTSALNTPKDKKAVKELPGKQAEKRSNFMKSSEQTLRPNVSRDACQLAASAGNMLEKNDGRAIQNTKSPNGSFNKLNNMCINFYKSLLCDSYKNYKAVLEIDSVKYFGTGKSSEEANERAAGSYLQAINVGTHQKLVNSRKSVKNVAPNSSFIMLNEMYDGLHYQTIGRDEKNLYKTVIQVDSVKHYGAGRTLQSAANNAAETCLLSMKHIKNDRHIELVSSIER